MTPQTMIAAGELAVPCLRANERPPKPRARGVTEIRGPYYSVVGPRYLTDVLDAMGEHVDPLRFAGGSFVQLECVRRGIWGTKSRWGRVVTYTGG
jgi:phosphosulfolactate synthase (CoM biosynthesis protein A)